MINKEEVKLLLNFAREVILSKFTKKTPDVEKVKKFNEKKGVFITIYKKGELRGCIGFPKPFFPLYKGIMQAAESAAFMDPRFPPLKEEELKDIEIELSILSEPELIKVKNPMEYLKKIQIGRDGLIIEFIAYSGLLLPHVAEEYNWNVEQFLDYACLKAGLPMNMWRTEKDIKIYKFQTERFREKEVL